VLRKQPSALSNDTEVSKAAMCSSEGLQKSASSAGKFETVSTPMSSEYDSSSKNLTVYDGGPSSLWSTNRPSDMSIDSEMLRVSESSSTTELVQDTASAVAVTDVGHSESETFPTAVETPSDGEMRKIPSDRAVDEDEVVHVPEASEVEKTDHQNEAFYPRCDGDGNKDQDNTAENASYVQVAKDYPTSDDTGIEHQKRVEHQKTYFERMFEAVSDHDVVTMQNADSKEVTESCTETDVVVEHVIHDLETEPSRTSMQLSSEVSTANVQVAEDVADDTGDDTAVKQMTDSTAGEELWPVIRSESTDLKESSSSEDLPASQAPVSMIDLLPPDDFTASEKPLLDITSEFTDLKENSFSEDLPASQVPVSMIDVLSLDDSTASEELRPVIRSESADLKKSSSSEDLPASQAPVSMFDVLPLDELPSDFDDARDVEAEINVVEKEVDLDSSVAEHDLESYSEWPPLPSDDELKISRTELETSSIDDLECDMDTELHPTSPQQDVSLAAESGTLAVGASEKILSKAAHLRDSMHRFW